MSDMDEKQYLDGNVLRGLFAQGVRAMLAPYTLLPDEPFLPGSL